MICGGPRGEWRIKHVLIALAGSLIPTAYVVIRSCLSGSWGELWLHNFSGTWGLISDSPYQDDRSVTIKMHWLRDTGFCVLAIMSLVSGFRRRLGRGHQFVLLTCVWMSVTLFLTPGPFPYYMMSILPMFAIAIGGWAASVLMDSSPAADPSRWKSWLILPLAVVLLLPPLIRLQHLRHVTVGFQKTVVRLGQQLTDESTSVFDGAGILLNRPDAYPFHWVLWISERERLAAGELPPLIETLKHNQCRLVIDNFRTQSLPADVRTELERQFVSLWGPFRVPGFDSLHPIDTTPQTFELWYDGIYQPNRDDILIDGVPLREPKFLTAGNHTVSVTNGQGRVKLADVTRSQHVELPADTAREIWGEYGFRY